MRQREYEITIGPDGAVEILVKGHKGKSCLEVAKLFEKVVGETQSTRLTSDYYDPEEHVQYRVEQRS